MLWFSMMVMLTGPAALAILVLAKLVHASETKKISIAKTLMVSNSFMFALQPD